MEEDRQAWDQGRGSFFIEFLRDWSSRANGTPKASGPSRAAKEDRNIVSHGTHRHDPLDVGPSMMCHVCISFPLQGLVPQDLF